MLYMCAVYKLTERHVVYCERSFLIAHKHTRHNRNHSGRARDRDRADGNSQQEFDAISLYTPCELHHICGHAYKHTSRIHTHARGHFDRKRDDHNTYIYTNHHTICFGSHRKTSTELIFLFYLRYMWRM